MTDTITAAKGRALQHRKAKRPELGVKARQRFLDHLAATCNVQASATAAGFAQTTSFYRLRAHDEAFASAWREAMRIGYYRLEEALLARALEQVGASRPLADADAEAVAADPDAIAIELVDERGAGAKPPRGGLAVAAGLPPGIARVDVQLALALLNRQAAIDRNGPERRRRRATAEEVEAAVSEKLDRLARQLALHRA